MSGASVFFPSSRLCRFHIRYLHLRVIHISRQRMSNNYHNDNSVMKNKRSDIYWMPGQSVSRAFVSLSILQSPKKQTCENSHFRVEETGLGS